MTKKQGALANDSGNILEQTVKNVFSKKGFEIEFYKNWKNATDKYGKEILLLNIPFTTVYDHKGYTEFLAISEKYGFKIRIECKWQQSAGSVDEKLPYLYLNAIEKMPENNIIIVIDGEGFKEGAKIWLKNAVKEKKYTDDSNRQKIVQVFNLTEFITWANKILR